MIVNWNEMTNQAQIDTDKMEMNVLALTSVIANWTDTVGVDTKDSKCFQICANKHVKRKLEWANTSESFFYVFAMSLCVWEMVR